MDRTISTLSQTPRTYYTKRLSLTHKAQIESPKLKRNFERIQAEQELKKIQNRIQKLSKIENTLNREIDFAQDKFEYLKSLQRENHLYLQQKQLHKTKFLSSIEDKRRSLSISRQERRTKKERVLEECFLTKKSKVDLIKSLKNSWEKSFIDKRNEELRKKTEFNKRVKEIKKKNQESRCQSQASARKFVAQSYAGRISEQEVMTSALRKEAQYLAEIEQKFVEKLSSTINMRNKHLSGLNNLMAISKLPLSQRSG